MTETHYEMCSSCGGSGIGASGDVASDCFSCKGEGAIAVNSGDEFYQFKPLVFQIERDEIGYDTFYTLVLENGESFDLPRSIFDALVTPADMEHFISFNETGWSLQHPLVCRPNLLACPVDRTLNEMAQDWNECPVDYFGTYSVVISDDDSYSFAPLREADDV